MLIRATVDFQYRRQEENDHLEINLTALRGLWTLKLNIPTVQLEWEKGPQLEVEETTVAPTGEKRKARNRFKFRYVYLQFFYHFIPIIPNMLLQMQRIKNKFYRGIHCTLVDWKIGIGLEDPADTAIAAGGFWGMLGYSLAKLYRQVTMDDREPKILVEPNFQNQGFYCKFHCIFNLRIGHIILVGLDLVRTFIRGKRRTV